MLACAFLARVLRTAGASLEGVLSGTQPASLRSYSRGSYNPTLPVPLSCSSLPRPTSSIGRAPDLVLRGLVSRRLGALTVRDAEIYR